MKNIPIFGVLLLWVALPFSVLADTTCDDALAEAMEQFKQNNYENAREAFQFVIERCGPNYGNATYWATWKQCKAKTKNHILVGHWLGAEFGYDHLFTDYRVNRIIDGFTEYQTKAGMDGFHLGPTYRFYDYNTGLGMQIGFWYQFVTCNGSVFDTKEEREKDKKILQEIKDSYEQADVWDRWSVYHRMCRHAFQIPIRFCYTFNELDDFGLSIYCGPTIEVGLAWEEKNEDTGVVKKATSDIWYGIDGCDVSGMRLGDKSIYDYYTGNRIYTEYAATGPIHDKTEKQEGGDLSRLNVLIGGGISFNMPNVQIGMGFEYGLLNLLAPHRRELQYNNVSCIQDVHVMQLSVNFSFAVELW